MPTTLRIRPVASHYAPAFLFRQVLRNRPIKTVCFLGIAALSALLAWKHFYWIAASLSVFIVLLLLGPRIDYWFAKRRLAKSPFYRQVVRLKLDATGFEETTELSSEKLNWQAFTKAVRLPDGFLLFNESTVSQWLPHAAITEGDVNEAWQLIEGRIARHAG